jgi:hypothetical protein
MDYERAYDLVGALTSVSYDLLSKLVSETGVDYFFVHSCFAVHRGLKFRELFQGGSGPRF